MKKLHPSQKIAEIGSLASVLSVLLLTACGGGGGGSTPAATTPVVVTPGVTITPVVIQPGQPTPGAITPPASGVLGASAVPPTVGVPTPAVTNAYIGALTSTGLYNFQSGFAGSPGNPASGIPATSGIAPVGTVNQGTLAANVATISTRHSTLTAAKTWAAGSAQQGYVLNAAGTWVTDTAAVQGSANANGTVNVADPYMGNVTFTPTAIDISGRPISAAASGIPMTFTLSGSGVPAASAVVAVQGATWALDTGGLQPAVVGGVGMIPATTVYPAGSVLWLQTGMVSTQDSYAVWAPPVGSTWTNTVSTPAGALTTAITAANAANYTLTNPICDGNFAYSKSANQTGVVAGSVRFDVYSSGFNPVTLMPSCTAINTVAPVGGTANFLYGTVDFNFVTVRGAAITTFSNAIAAPTGFAPTWLTAMPTPAQPTVMQGNFWAVVNGQLQQGWYQTKGWSDDIQAAVMGNIFNTQLNKTAMQAVMTATGLPMF